MGSSSKSDNSISMVGVYRSQTDLPRLYGNTYTSQTYETTTRPNHTVSMENLNSQQKFANRNLKLTMEDELSTNNSQQMQTTTDHASRNNTEQTAPPVPKNRETYIYDTAKTNGHVPVSRTPPRNHKILSFL